MKSRARQLFQHVQSHLDEYLREIMYGGVDGIITTFAVVAGFTGAQFSNSTVLQSVPVIAVLLFGLANLFADGLSMAVGNFLSTRANKSKFRSQRRLVSQRVRDAKQAENKRTVEMFVDRGYSSQTAIKLASLLAERPKTWTEIKMLLEEKTANPLDESAVGMALATFFSFAVFGFIPLIPYILFLNSEFVFLYSAIFTGIALVLLGTLRFGVEKQSFYQSILETLALGSIAAITAFGVGTLFH